MQRLYDRFDHPPGEIESELQRQALAEHGLCRCWLHAYWNTSSRFPKGPLESEEIRSAVVYLRYFERTLDSGRVRVGDPVPAIPLVDMASKATVTLLEKYHHGRALVVIAGSGS